MALLQGIEEARGFRLGFMGGSKNRLRLLSRGKSGQVKKKELKGGTSAKTENAKNSSKTKQERAASEDSLQREEPKKGGEIR